MNSRESFSVYRDIEDGTDRTVSESTERKSPCLKIASCSAFLLFAQACYLPNGITLIWSGINAFRNDRLSNTIVDMVHNPGIWMYVELTTLFSAFFQLRNIRDLIVMLCREPSRRKLLPIVLFLIPTYGLTFYNYFVGITLLSYSLRYNFSLVMTLPLGLVAGAVSIFGNFGFILKHGKDFFSGISALCSVVGAILTCNNDRVAGAIQQLRDLQIPLPASFQKRGLSTLENGGGSVAAPGCRELCSWFAKVFFVFIPLGAAIVPVLFKTYWQEGGVDAACAWNRLYIENGGNTINDSAVLPNGTDVFPPEQDWCQESEFGGGGINFMGIYTAFVHTMIFLFQLMQMSVALMQRRPHGKEVVASVAIALATSAFFVVPGLGQKMINTDGFDFFTLTWLLTNFFNNVLKLSDVLLQPFVKCLEKRPACCDGRAADKDRPRLSQLTTIDSPRTVSEQNGNGVDASSTRGLGQQLAFTK